MLPATKYCNAACMCLPCTHAYRIAGIFRGYKCSWFSRIRHVPRKSITANLISHACMLQTAAIPRKLNPHFRENLYPRNIPAIYGIYSLKCLIYSYTDIETITSSITSSILAKQTWWEERSLDKFLAMLFLEFCLRVQLHVHGRPLQSLQNQE